jgi:hypothetical protein
MVSLISGHFYVSRPETEYGSVTAGDRPENGLVDVPEEGKTGFDRGFTSDIVEIRGFPTKCQDLRQQWEEDATKKYMPDSLIFF